jgi:hypothetical protein
MRGRNIQGQRKAMFAKLKNYSVSASINGFRLGSMDFKARSKEHAKFNAILNVKGVIGPAVGRKIKTKDIKILKVRRLK